MLDQEDVVEILAIRLLGIIPEDSAIVSASNKGEPVVMNGKSLSGEAYRRIARRLEGEDVPFIEPSSDSGFSIA